MEAANEVPGLDERCEESTDAPWPAAIPPVGHKEHTRDSTSRHSPGTTGGDPRAAPGSRPQGSGAAGPGARTPSSPQAVSAQPHSTGMAGYPGPVETSPSCNEQIGGTPRFIFLPLLYETPLSL